MRGAGRLSRHQGELDVLEQVTSDPIDIDVKDEFASFAVARTASPILSVTVLNYNYGRYLRECLESILKQSFQDFELIIIDDCSSDDSLSVALPFCSDPRVRLIAHRVNQGFCKSLIEGMEQLSRGKYIMVISADDLVLDRDAFRLQVGLLDQSNDISFCFSTGVKIEQGLHRNMPAPITPGVMPGLQFLEKFLSGVSIQIVHSGAMIRRSLYERAGGYRRDLQYCLDTSLWMTLPWYGSVAYLDRACYGYRSHDSQMSESSVAVRAHVDEAIAAIDSTFRLQKLLRQELRVTRSQALRAYLPAMAVSDAFADQPQLALRRCIAGLRSSPWAMISAKRTWITFLRCALGARGFAALRRLSGRKSPLEQAWAG